MIFSSENIIRSRAYVQDFVVCGRYLYSPRFTPLGGVSMNRHLFKLLSLGFGFVWLLASITMICFVYCGFDHKIWKTKVPLVLFYIKMIFGIAAMALAHAD